jgi:RimJ/RimL family protein N-acetyltransferase
VIRPLTLEDTEELAALYAGNREFLRPFEPDRDDAFFTPAGQRARIAQRVLEKNGFRRIGIAHGYLRVGGRWRDHVLFQRLLD